ncbi:hypothetical protein HDA32_002595 [Spinactinospora alkalitolerans]|uniref:DUF393 domain-containing protein n=1 Tax=Spinactinospora alkalitolerans TaxID=687207 RepID=A0A852TVQ1_9ACTN|nr:DCC1-like thiol-disulfide oxidoreductase family protein [Spinactinospora alkalitolerans]NYE47475.1 hypothetical protein [Spinactinospora alkalitolerans]
MAATTPARSRAAAPPVRGLVVLYDADCPLCRHLRGWLGRQPRLVPLDFVPAGSAEAAIRYPHLDHSATLREITVIGDSGQVWTDARAFVVCLWALAGYRPMADRFCTPSGARLARGALLAASGYRKATRSPGRPGPDGEEDFGPRPRDEEDRPPSDGCDDRCPVPD